MRPRIIKGIDAEVDAYEKSEKIKQRNKRQKEDKAIILADPELRAAYEDKERRQQIWRKYITPEIAFDPVLADAIIDLIASGFSLKRACDLPGMPDPMSVRKWVVRHGEFSLKYARALLSKAQVHADEILDIADDSRNDWECIIDQNGEKVYILRHDHVKRQQLRIETRKWYLSKVLPKQFGDATLLKLADADGNKLPTAPPTLVIRGIAPKVIKSEG
jgi:hypothetical protein